MKTKILCFAALCSISFGQLTVTSGTGSSGWVTGFTTSGSTTFVCANSTGSCATFGSWTDSGLRETRPKTVSVSLKVVKASAKPVQRSYG